MLKAIFGQQVFGQTQSDAAETKDKTTTITPPETKPVRRDIDVKTAIDAHIRWRHRLEEFIRGTSQEQLVVETVAADNRCELGQWIHGDGRRQYGQLDLFVDLEAAHALFHQLAGDILATAMGGQRDDALIKLQTGSFPRASGKVKNLLAKLYVEVLCAENPVPGHIDPHPPAIHR